MYKSLIIGAGNIASGFDDITNSSVLTHAHAYINNPEIELLGFYDTDYEKAQSAAKKWGVKAFKEPVNADIISICVPDEYHAETLLNVQNLQPKLIFLEKPVCTKKDNPEILKNIKTPILINYSRCFSKSFQELANRIKSKEFGSYENGFGFYGKGFIHNGSHLINLLNLLIGKIEKIDFKNEINDYFENDTSKEAFITFKNGKQFTMIPANCNNFTIFEFDIIFEKARIRMVNSGFELEIYKVQDSEKYTGYKNLILSEKITTDLDFAMSNAVQNIVDYLNGNADLMCTLNDGLEAVKYG